MVANAQPAVTDDGHGRARRFAGKRVILTGAGSRGDGIGNGRAAGVLYAREGARLVLVDRDRQSVEDTAALIRAEGGECTTVTCDVTNPEGVDTYVTHALDALGGVDVLHCNVGIAADDTTTAMSLKRWRLVYRVNVDSLLFACQAVLPHMRAEGGGAIVNISSIASVRSTGTPFPAYASSKAAANALVREVAIEGAPYGIRANTVLIGFVDTPTVAAAYADHADEWEEFVDHRTRAIPRGSQGTAFDTARAALFLASDDADFITGSEIVVDGGMTHVSGGPLFNRAPVPLAGATPDHRCTPLNRNTANEGANMAEDPEQRVPTVKEVDPDLAETLAKTLSDPTGQPLNIFLTMAQHPRLLKRWNVLAGLFMSHGLLDPRERELVVLRTAWRTRARYEWGQHVLIARDAGVTEGEIERITTDGLDAWPHREQTVLRFTDELLRDVDVSDATWELAAELLDQAQLIELVMLVGLYRMAAGFLNTLRVSSERHLPGWPAEKDAMPCSLS